MPIPNKKSGETESKFIGRCMEAIGGEYNEEQALAICYGKFRENMKRKNEQKSVISKINEFKKKYEGINLDKVGEVDLKEPCWDGYEQYGTKVVDGREVPNCIPID